ncbi:hypothetical protein V2B37_08205 [Natranaerobius thermophilus JW/NM-WN-LF]
MICALVIILYINPYLFYTITFEGPTEASDYYLDSIAKSNSLRDKQAFKSGDNTHVNFIKDLNEDDNEYSIYPKRRTVDVNVENQSAKVKQYFMIKGVPKENNENISAYINKYFHLIEVQENSWKIDEVELQDFEGSDYIKEILYKKR